MLKVLGVALRKACTDPRSAGGLWREFQWIWLIAVICWPDHSIRPLNPAECPENIRPEGCDRIRSSILYRISDVYTSRGTYEYIRLRAYGSKKPVKRYVATGCTGIMQVRDGFLMLTLVLCQA